MLYKSLLLRARLATSLMFFINGVVLAIWATNIPELKRNLALTDQQLGFALSGFAAGTMITMYIAGILATKIGTRNTLVLGGILLSFTIPLCAYAPSYTTFVASILLLGVINSIYDVAMNSHACVIEIERKKVLMPSFHALFSIGGLIGASTVAVLLSDKLGATYCLTLAGVLVFVATIISAFFLVDIRPEVQANEGKVKFRLPNRTLLYLAFLTFLALFIERTLIDWSSLYLTDISHVSTNIAALGFAGFSLAMALTRLSGDYFINKFGESKVLITSGLAGAIGLLLAIIFPTPTVSILGFLVVGLGLGNMIPVFYSRAGKVFPESPAVGYALNGTLGYTGFLIAPIIIGSVSTDYSLRIAMVLPVLAFIFLTIVHMKPKQVSITTPHAR
ncbi:MULTISPECIES: MFS transporter [Acinetobacter]|uniref:MFS transporter n=4 Tax=Acinetobacter baumannii TaxID=470 RepID=A0A6I4HPH8_ACIBA|nr:MULTISPECIES: MFS transporter [Acinetobacter]AIL80817.1 hypothetical protein IX87_20030 [Acinetobacter baumannii]AIS06571.1 hypothetical protein LX00_09335 [Acinetobacter baumannii]APJ19506.1 hypothetical protein BS064_10515 [Acinetobacter baumannii]ATD21297.1 MFS transporter [Acinetobacter baumannii]AVE55309.1 MFS transporter [Acinetobacter baumannii]